MELLLNFVWIVVSLALIGWQIRESKAAGRRVDWRIAIALGMLLLMLLPVISITDDLMAMAATTTDAEHTLRRPMEPIQPAPVLAMLELAAAAALLLFGMLRQRLLTTSSRTYAGLARLLQGLVRVSSVRPPPTPGAFEACA